MNTLPEPPRRGLAIFESRWFWLAVVLVSFGLPLGLSLSRPQLKAPAVFGRMHPFSVKDPSGADFVSEYTLSGIVSVFSFIDPDCTAPECGVRIEELKRLRQSLKGAGPTVRIVSISARPGTENEREKLGEIAKEVTAGSRLWNFITGTPAELHELAADNLSLGARAADLPALARQGTVIVVDQAGQIRGVHDLADAHVKVLNVLVMDIAFLVNTKPVIETKPRT